MILKQQRDEEKQDISIPLLKVKIHRRKSACDPASEIDLFRGFLLRSRKRSSIPKVQVLYDQDPSNQSAVKDHRPSTSPISAILKSQDTGAGMRKLNRAKQKDLPVIKRHFPSNINEMAIEGNSVKCCDWLNLFGVFSPLYAETVDKRKNLNREASELPERRRNIKSLMRRRLIKGRCL